MSHNLSPFEDFAQKLSKQLGSDAPMRQKSEIKVDRVLNEGFWLDIRNNTAKAPSVNPLSLFQQYEKDLHHLMKIYHKSLNAYSKDHFASDFQTWQEKVKNSSLDTHEKEALLNQGALLNQFSNDSIW